MSPYPPSAPGVGTQAAEVAVDAAEPLAVDILQLCTPLDFHPPTLQAWLDEQPQLQSMDTRTRVGSALARLIADGAAASPHALVLLAKEFHWSDARSSEDPALHDARFLWRLDAALTGSRPSTRRASSAEIGGFSIGCVILASLFQVLRDTHTRFDLNGAMARLGTPGDKLALGVAGVAGLALLAFEIGWRRRDRRIERGRILPIAVRGGAALLIAGAALYCIGRP